MLVNPTAVIAESPETGNGPSGSDLSRWEMTYHVQYDVYLQCAN
jgi:hypothetical protein